MRALGELAFKNIAAPIEVFSIEDSTRVANIQVTDPVCHMLVDPDAVPARLPYGDRQFYFCSLVCAQKFAEQSNSVMLCPQERLAAVCDL